METIAEPELVEWEAYHILVNDPKRLKAAQAKPQQSIEEMKANWQLAVTHYERFAESHKCQT